MGYRVSVLVFEKKVLLTAALGVVSYAALEKSINSVTRTQRFLNKSYCISLSIFLQFFHPPLACTHHLRSVQAAADPKPKLSQQN
jgi:hypothetical protein